MNVLQFSDLLEESVREGKVDVQSLKEALITALLEVDRSIRPKVIEKVMRNDFGFTAGT